MNITITPNILQFTDVLLDLPRINLFLYKRSVGHERTFVCMSMLSNVYLNMRAFELHLTLTLLVKIGGACTH